MVRYELKKISNLKMVFCFLMINFLFCCLFWVQNRGVERAKNTKIMQNLYDEIGGKITDENAEKIEALMQRKDDIIGSESSFEQKYNRNEISIDEYIEYRDEFHLMYSRHEEIDLMYERYLTNKANGSWMLFDGYYNQLFQPERNQWGLVLSVFLLIVLLSCCEPIEFFSVVSITQKGKYGVWTEKLKTILVLGAIVTLLYAFEECAIMASFSPFPYLNAPVQSISCLSDVHISINIVEWMLLTLGIRIIVIMVVSSVFCTFLYFMMNKKMGILILITIVFIPMLLSEALKINTCNIISKLITVYPLFM